MRFTYAGACPERNKYKMSNSNLQFEKERLTAKRILTLLIQGALIGGGGIIPGVSGGILCVAFGLYMPLMQLFSNPLKEIPKTWKKWMLVGIGGCIGLLLFALIIDVLFETSENIAQSLFAGLIAGTFPSLIREAKNDPKKKDSGSRKARYISFVLAVAISLPIFIFLSLAEDKSLIAITPNSYWYGVCGFIIGMGFVIPGLSSSPILIFLGLLKPMLDGAVSFDFGVIIPVCIGVAAAVLLLARLMSFIFGRFYTVAFCTVIGIVLSSTLVIIPTEFASVLEIFICIAVAVVGCFAALMLDKKLSGFEK